MNKNYDKQIFRLLYILNKLDSGNKVTSRELAEEFNISMRSVQRDLELINMTGFPIISIRKGVYGFTEGFSLKKALLTREEASLLAFLNEVASSLGPKFEDSFRKIFSKVLYRGSDSPYYAKVPTGEKIGSQFPFLPDLERAIEEELKVELDYLVQGKEKWLKVNPLKIAHYDGFWYLICQVSHRDWILKLKLESILRLKVLDERYEIPANLKALLDQSVNIWFGEKRDKKVVLKVDADVARYFRKREYFPLQKIRKVNKDGALVIESMVGEYMEILPTVFSWLPHVKVVKPVLLRMALIKTLQNYPK